jgi:hypothetical protein
MKEVIMGKTTIKSKLSQKNTGILAFILAFAGIGGWIIIDSFAAVPSNPQVGFYNYASVSNINQNNVYSYPDAVAGIGSQTIINILPTGKMTFVTGGKLVPTTICYFAKVYNSPKDSPPGTSATATFVGTGSSKTVTLPDDGNYHEVCVPSGNKAQLPFNVENRSASGPSVFVYQAVVKY